MSNLANKSNGSEKEILSSCGLPEEKIGLLKKTICKDATDVELALFMHICNKVGLDPFMKQIYAIRRGNQMTTQTSIDGLRLIADRTKNYAPGRSPEYLYENKEVIAATSFLKKRTEDGMWHDVSAKCFMKEYRPTMRNTFWDKMPHVMLAKCAEAVALRRAFPAEMSGLYIAEEMDQIPDSHREELLEKLHCLLLDRDDLRDRIHLAYKVKDISELKKDALEVVVKGTENLIKKEKEKEQHEDN